MIVGMKNDRNLCQWQTLPKVHLSNYGFLAGSTDSFSNSLDSKSVEV